MSDRGSSISEWKPQTGWKALFVQFFDVLVAGGLGLISFLALNERDVALVIWGVGLIVVSHRLLVVYALRSHIEPIERNFGALSRIVDLSQSSRIDDLSNLQKIYLSITEPELEKVKAGVLENATSRLERLAHDMRSDELPTSEYYSWLLPALDEVQPGQSVNAISCMFEAEWDDSPAERQFIESNIAAAKRGVRVERIFLMNPDQLPDAVSLPPVACHINGTSENLIGFFVDRSKLENDESQLLEDIGDGLILLNDRVALVDEFIEGGNVRGVVTMNPTELRLLKRIFGRLKIHAEPLKEAAQKAVSS